MISKEVIAKLAGAVELWAEDNLEGKPAILANCVCLSLVAELERKDAEIQSTFGEDSTAVVSKQTEE